MTSTAPVSTPTTGLITSLGVGSGLDVNSIISQLMAVESQPLTQLNAQEASYQAELSAYGNLKSALSSFQSSLSALNTLSTFQSRSADSSNTGAATATASANAATGTYNLQVNQLAQAQSMVAAGQTSSTTAIGTGLPTTITFQFGTISGGTLTNGVYSGATFTQNGAQPSATITIDSSNNSLQGIRDAINNAGIGVAASIVNDGSGTPYRLVLQSSQPGAASSMSIAVSGDSALQNLLSYDPTGTQRLTQVIAAQDASLSINGLSITSHSNSVSSAVDGITFNLLGTGQSQISVAADTSGIQTAVSGFVQAYNQLQSQLSSLTSYDPTSNQAGTLLGDFTVQQIQSQLARVLSSALAGSGQLSLGQVGVTLQQDGTLSLDSGKLQNALATNPSALAGVFTAAGTASDSLISINASSAATQAGNYAVNIAQLATQGQLVGSAAAGLTITAGQNDQLSVTVDGVSTSVTLAPGTYTASSLAALVQAAINGSAALQTAGSSVSVSQSGGVLTITSSRFGSASNVTLSGSAAANLVGSAPTATAGIDVAGTIGGIAASGSGQVLTGAAGTATEGLQLQVSGGSLGSRGTVSFSRGYADQLDTLIAQFLASNGSIANRIDGINAQIDDVNQQITRTNVYLQQVQANYQAQFTALDTFMVSMQSTSNFLTQQLAVLNTTAATNASLGGSSNATIK